MARPKLVVPLMVALLTLSACGNPFGADSSRSNAQHQTPQTSSPSSSSSASPSASASPSGSSSPAATPTGNTITSVSPSPSETSESAKPQEKKTEPSKNDGSTAGRGGMDPSYQATKNPPGLDAVVHSNKNDASAAAPGTACGSNTLAANSMVYIAKADNKISCDIAQTVIDAYEAELKANRTGGNAAHATVHGYQCSSPTAASSTERSLITVCENESKGIKIAVRAGFPCFQEPMKPPPAPKQLLPQTVTPPAALM